MTYRSLLLIGLLALVLPVRAGDSTGGGGTSGGINATKLQGYEISPFAPSGEATQTLLWKDSIKQRQASTLAPGGVTAISITSANGISGSSSGGATPALTLALGAITPSTVTIGGGSAITSSGAGGALGSAAFTASTAYDASGAAAAITLSGLGGVPTTRTVNSKALSGNITLSASDVGADASGAAAAVISDTAYDATSWDGVTTIAPSKNAVRDKIETLGTAAYTASTAYDASGAAAAILASPTFTGTVTTPNITLSGNQSAAAWTTSGLRLKGISGTLTDTTSSGTVAAAYTNKLGGNTIAASSATTFTDYISGYFSEPVQGTNVTLTNKWALGADSLYVGTSNPFKVTSAGAVTAVGSVTAGKLSSGTAASGIGAGEISAATSSSRGIYYFGSGGTQYIDVSSGVLNFNGITSIVGGAGNMTFTSGTGNSRTMILKTTTSGGTATTALTLGADQRTSFNAPANVKSYTVSTLPTGNAGDMAQVSDGDSSLAWGATVVNSGSGATKYLVWFNGSNWTVAGK